MSRNCFLSRSLFLSLCGSWTDPCEKEILWLLSKLSICVAGGRKEHWFERKTGPEMLQGFHTWTKASLEWKICLHTTSVMLWDECSVSNLTHVPKRNFWQIFWKKIVFIARSMRPIACKFKRLRKSLHSFTWVFAVSWLNRSHLFSWLTTWQN